MAHIGQEFGLGLVGLLGRAARFLDGGFGLLAGGDVVDPARQGGLAVVFQPLPGQQAPEHLAIGAVVLDLGVAQLARPAEDLQQPLAFSRVDPHLAGQPGGLVLAIAVDLVVGGVAIEVTPLFGEDHHRDRRRLEQPMRLVRSAVPDGLACAHPMPSQLGAPRDGSILGRRRPLIVQSPALSRPWAASPLQSQPSIRSRTAATSSDAGSPASWPRISATRALSGASKAAAFSQASTGSSP